MIELFLTYARQYKSKIAQDGTVRRHEILNTELEITKLTKTPCYRDDLMTGPHTLNAEDGADIKTLPPMGSPRWFVHAALNAGITDEQMVELINPHRHLRNAWDELSSQT